MLKLVGLKTEYQTKPLAIENKTPRFSWQYPQAFTGEQVNYRVLVATKAELLETGKADMWDSGVVASSDSIGVEYAGKALASHSRYYVVCFTQDNQNNTYASEIETFETALYNAEDWQGKWVSVPVNFNGGTLFFRKVFELEEKKIVRARAYVCGIGYHEFFVNGKKMGDAVLNPSISEYSERVLYCAYEMDGLTAGKNVMAVELGYGWLGDRKLLLQIYVEYEDGTVYEDHSCPVHGWWVGGSPTIDNSVYGGEVYDARIEDKYPKNWNALDFEPTWANGWMYTIYTSAPRGKLEAQQIEPIKVCEQYPEIGRTDKGNGIYIVDIGANIAGWLRIRAKGERGATITLKFGEQLTEDGYVNQLNLRSARCSDTYILKGEGIEEFAPRFTFHGFRYVQAEIIGNAELVECIGEHVHTATNVIGKFECSDTGLNKLHEIALRTEQNNEHAILSDCPQRDERFGWLNDLGSRIYQTMYNIDMARFIPKFIRDITHTQTEEGGIGDTAPYYTGGVPADPVCVIYPLLANYAYRYYGDSATGKAEYVSVRKWVEYLLSRSQNYIMDYYYYADWVRPFADVNPDNLYVSSMYLLWHLKEMRRLAEIVGNQADEKLYAAHVEKSIRALHEKYFDEKTCNYSLGTQTENALALSLGVVPARYEEAVAKNLYEDCVRRNHHCTSGNIGYRHVFYMLAKYGYADEVIRILKNPEYPGWGYMLANDATSVWERWEAEMQNEMHSFNHPMFGSYDAFLYRFLGGIEICEDAVACDKILIQPIFATSIDYATSEQITVRGKIVSSWKRENNVVSVHVEIPPQTKATVRLGDTMYEVNAGIYDYIVK